MRSNVDELKLEARAAQRALDRVLKPSRLRRLLIAELLDDKESTNELIGAVGWIRFFTALLETGVLRATRDVETVAATELVKVREYRAVLEFYARVADGESKEVPA